MSRTAHIKGRVLVAALSLWSCAGARADDPALRQRVLAEYPRKFAELQSRYEHSTGKVLERIVRHVMPPVRPDQKGRIPKLKPLREREYEFLCSRPERARVLLRYLSAPKRVLEYVACFNERYGYMLTRFVGRPEYAVSSIDQDGVAERNACEIYLNPFLGAPYQLSLLPTMQFLEGKHVRSLEFSKVDRNGKPCIKVVFDAGPVFEGNQTDGHEGWFILSPDERWVVREYMIRQRPAPGKAHGTIDYEGELEGYPLLKRIKQESLPLNNDANPVQTTTFEVRELHFVQAPESDFTLAAFGLPELLDPPAGETGRAAPAPGATPNAGVRRSSNAGVWYLALGCATLAAAIALKLASSRVAARRAGAATEGPGSQ